MMRFCTSVTPETLPQVLVLTDAILRHHPHAAVHALVLGGNPRAWSGLRFDAVALSELDLEEATALGREHDPEDLELLLRAALMSRVRALGDPDVVCYLSSDHDVVGSLESVLHAHADVGLARRVDSELPDDTFNPRAEDLATRGLYTPDFLLVGREPCGQEFLSWYHRRLWSLAPSLEQGEAPPTRDAARSWGRRLLMLAPSLFSVQVVDDHGVEASFWNLHERSVTCDHGRAFADHRPLRTVHFSAFDPRKPYWLSDGSDRVRVVEHRALQDLCIDYAQRLLRHGWLSSDRRRDVGRRLPNGLAFDERLRRLYSEAANDGVDLGDVFTAGGCEDFMRWLLGPAPAGAPAGINRYLYRVYLDRPDLSQVYPSLDGAHGGEYVAWTWVFGRIEMSIPDEFLPPRPASVRDVGARADARDLGVNVAGYFRGTLGLGEAARLYVRGLDAAGISVTTTTVEVDRPVQQADRRLGKDYGKLAFADLRAAEESNFNLICVNADELPRFVADAGDAFFANRRSIGVWAWETDAVPERWDPAYAHLDEIWVYSRYVAENLARASPIPVVCVPPAVLPPESEHSSSGVELPEGFRFMFMLDFFSTQARKNPAGVIEAFAKAFAPGTGPQLLIKTIHAEARPRDYDELRYAAGSRPDIHIVDRALSVDAKNALMAECDCYVSLHRSEGYGLTLAECMALGKPVIGTAFSGNMDFMTAANAYLVDHAMTVVGDDVEIYPAEGRWAEPDLDHAAALMRGVYERPDEARERGARARDDIAAALSPATVGRIARARLERLAAFSFERSEAGARRAG